MDWKTFAVSIIDSIAWPGSIIILVFLLRKPIKILVEDRLDSLSYKDLSLKFSHSIEKLEEIAPKPVQSESKQTIQNSSLNFSQLESHTPEASIPYTWAVLENHLVNKIKELELSSTLSGPKNNPRQMMALLSEVTNIDPNAFRLFRQLAHMRNIVSHENITLNHQDVSSFIDYSNVLISMIDEAELESKAK